MNAEETMNTHTQVSATSSSDCEALIDCPAAGIKVKIKFQPTQSQRVIGSDAFSYYSNKLNLEKARQFKEDDVDVQVIQTSGITSQIQGPATKRRKGSIRFLTGPSSM